MRKLVLGAVTEWRMNSGASLDDDGNWKKIRLTVLERDGYTCHFCGFSSPSYMEVHHLRGRFDDNSPENLSTLCPFCHSCHHLGFSGLKEKGVLLELDSKFRIKQARLNRTLLDSLAEKGTPEVFDRMLSSLPVKENHGAEGLVMLANLIIQKESEGEDASPPGNLVYFPDYRKYDISGFLMRGGKRCS